MNIEIVAGKLRGFDCAECFRPCPEGTNGYHLKVARVNVVVAGIKVGEKSVDEDLHRVCGDALRARINDAYEKLKSGDVNARVCLFCGQACRATCATCSQPYHFDRTPCANEHFLRCKS